VIRKPSSKFNNIRRSCNNMKINLKNTLQRSTQIWDNSKTTTNRLRGAIDILGYYQNNLGSIDAYLGHFKRIVCLSESPMLFREWLYSSTVASFESN